MKNLFLLLLLCLCPIIFIGCEDANQPPVEEIDYNQEASTRSFDTYIDGFKEVYEGESHIYTLQSYTGYQVHYWQSMDAQLIQGKAYYAEFRFENPGTARITAHLIHPENFTFDYTYINVTVKELDSDMFLKSLSISGLKKLYIGDNASYSLDIPSNLYQLGEIDWSIDNHPMSINTTFNHIFNSEGTYTLKCSGSFYKNGLPLSFSKEIQVEVRSPERDIEITGPRNIVLGNTSTFSLSNPTTFSLSNITWKIYNNIVSNNTSFDYIFANTGGYILECSGNLTKNNITVPFTRTLYITVKPLEYQININIQNLDNLHQSRLSPIIVEIHTKDWNRCIDKNDDIVLYPTKSKNITFNLPSGTYWLYAFCVLDSVECEYELVVNGPRTLDLKYYGNRWNY